MPAKDCPKCRNAHVKPGKFCSRSCANSRVFSAESKEKKSRALRGKRPKHADKLKIANSPERNKWLTNLRAAWRQKYIETPFEMLGFVGKRRRVFEEQEYACAECGLTEWRGAAIALECDHVDGNRQNNTRVNLRGLCPNCHSLTQTWRGRNRKQNDAVSDAQLLSAIANTSGNIHRALIALGLAPKGKNYERAKRLLKIGAPGVAPGSQD